MNNSSIKPHKPGEFIVKPFTRKGFKYYRVIDTYDMSQAALEVTEGNAIAMANDLNEMRAKRLGLKS